MKAILSPSSLTVFDPELLAQLTQAREQKNTCFLVFDEVPAITRGVVIVYPHRLSALDIEVALKELFDAVPIDLTKPCYEKES